MSQQAYTLPQRAPLYEAPPFNYEAFSKVSVFCRVDEAAIRAALPLQFDVRGDVIEFFIMDVPAGGSLGSYAEGGIVVPMSYQGRPGGHVLYEIVTNDDSMAVGREVWGYPKKMGEVEWTATDSAVSAKLSRRGTSLIEIDFKADGPSFEKPLLHPRFQTRIIPSPESAAAETQVIENALGASTTIRQAFGTANIKVGGNASDPFSDFQIREIVGAEMVVANFVLAFGKIVG
ncbi:acetoacetate decarboxylase family protein [Mesorhizobium sp. BAC0120]|uniref:acetoacetate decarboxylase family protein n=1 Tax=Mesorhizobium sp. BAC0120 TaxID=3090670 RepID=UPI00298C4766|nr:acetoacetate decarboxylase family protein [Mesorhizobium sp. BAC0120]MDW6021843.1 acetoacetate decarboxylase family protein [Mesorhizobium sp. BAC0120]